uniref:ERF family protein n=1 Tax=Gudongella sp. SC589 TaxID=3385990 RepID=UPI003904DCE3
YSERYFLLKCLGLPTDEDDPDAKTQAQPTNQATNKKQQSPKNNQSLLQQMYELIKVKDMAEAAVDYTTQQFKKKHSKELTETEIKKTIEWLKSQ